MNRAALLLAFPLAGCTTLADLPPGVTLVNPACVFACQSATSDVAVEAASGASPSVTSTTGNSKSVGGTAADAPAAPPS